MSQAAMNVFWRFGYSAASIDVIASQSGASRHALYAEFDDKRALFLAALDRYRDDVVSPAFQAVEAGGAGLEAVAAFFETQIALAERLGLPGPGCFFVKAMNGPESDDAEIRAAIFSHNERLKVGFKRALRRDGAAPSTAERLAQVLLTFAQGLWSLSRIVPDARPLRAACREMLTLVRKEINT